MVMHRTFSMNFYMNNSIANTVACPNITNTLTLILFVPEPEI